MPYAPCCLLSLRKSTLEIIDLFIYTMKTEMSKQDTAIIDRYLQEKFQILQERKTEARAVSCGQQRRLNAESCVELQLADKSYKLCYRCSLYATVRSAETERRKPQTAGSTRKSSDSSLSTAPSITTLTRPKTADSAIDYRISTHHKPAVICEVPSDTPVTSSEPQNIPENIPPINPDNITFLPPISDAIRPYQSAHVRPSTSPNLPKKGLASFSLMTSPYQSPSKSNPDVLFRTPHRDRPKTVGPFPGPHSGPSSSVTDSDSPRSDLDGPRSGPRSDLDGSLFDAPPTKSQKRKAINKSTVIIQGLSRYPRSKFNQFSCRRSI